MDRLVRFISTRHRACVVVPTLPAFSSIRIHVNTVSHQAVHHREGRRRVQSRREWTPEEAALEANGEGDAVRPVVPQAWYPNHHQDQDRDWKFNLMSAKRAFSCWQNLGGNMQVGNRCIGTITVFLRVWGTNWDARHCRIAMILWSTGFFPKGCFCRFPHAVSFEDLPRNLM